MEKTIYAQRLMEFGLTRQEATVYQYLVTEGKRSGYEVARDTGISRSNAYTALANLADKGASYISEEGTTKKYVAVEIDEFCENYIRRLKNSKKWLTAHMPDAHCEEEGYITIEGEMHIADKVRNLLAGANERVYISCTRSYLLLFRQELKELLAAGKKVVIVTDQMAHIDGARVYVSEDKGSRIGVIADSHYVLTGEYGEASSNTCLYSGQKNFVELYKTALANEIKIINYMKGE